MPRVHRIAPSLCLLVWLLAFPALHYVQADTYSVPETNIVLTYEVSDGQATITDCNRDATGSLTIPSDIDGSPVMFIDDSAFNSCSSLTSVTIPASVTSIGSGAFYSCHSLSSIHLPDGLTTISSYAFGECPFTSITIPSSVTSIGRGVFNESKVTSVAFQGDAPADSEDIATYEIQEEFTIYHWDTATGFDSYPWTNYNVVAVSSVDPGITNWRKLNAIPSEASMSDDLNGDGVELMMAYALDLNFDANLQSELPSGNFINSGDSFGITYFAGRTDVTYTVECSPDLSEWTTDGVIHSAPDIDGRVASFVSTEGEDDMFLRLIVEESVP